MRDGSKCSNKDLYFERKPSCFNNLMATRLSSDMCQRHEQEGSTKVAGLGALAQSPHLL